MTRLNALPRSRKVDDACALERYEKRASWGLRALKVLLFWTLLGCLALLAGFVIERVTP